MLRLLLHRCPFSQFSEFLLVRDLLRIRLGTRNHTEIQDCMDTRPRDQLVAVK